MRYAFFHLRGVVALALIPLVAGAGMLAAQDGGHPWPDPVNSASEVMPRASSSVLLDALALDDGRLVAVGERGHVLVSDDGGGRWQQAAVPTRSTLTRVAANGGNIVVVGHDGVIVHSADRGDTWQRVREEPYSIDNQSSPSNGSPLLDVMFLDASRVLAVGAYNLALMSRDAGLNWEPVPIELAVDPSRPNGDIEGSAATPAPGDVEDIAGEADAAEASVLFSEDELLLDDEADPHLNAIVRLGDGVLLIVGERGTVYRSSDDGKSWQRLPLPYGGSMFGALALGDSRVIVFGLRGRAFESDDAGDSWRAIELPVQATLFGASAGVDGSVALVGAEGAILRRALGSDTFAVSVYVTDTGETPSNSAVLSRDDGSLILIGERGVAAWRQP